jgi:hypothetical protein
MRRVATFLMGLSFILMSTAASAQTPPILRPGTHPMWATLGMGPAIKLKDSATQFKLAPAFGYHFNGTFAGPAIVGEMQLAFGNSVTNFVIGPKFAWDIQPKADLGLLLSPTAMIGYSYSSVSVCFGGGFFGNEVCESAGTSAFDIQFGFEGKLVLGDRGLVFFRPLTIDIQANGDGVGVRYDLMFGGGAIF